MTKKKTKTQDAGSAIPQTAIAMIEYERLVRAPENVRQTDQVEGVPELAEDIRSHGLLQSLIGYDGGNGLIYVVGGGRRLAALELLHGNGLLPPDFKVPLQLRDREEAVELSLSENLARRDMNPADELAAFELLMKPGTLSPADLAKRFGFTERYVKQRLRLGALVPEIIDALRERVIGLDSAMAYASSQDRELQLQVFKEQSKSHYEPHSPRSVRNAYLSASKTTESALYRFVGAKAYERAGGGYEDDLFVEGETGRRLTAGFLLARLASEHAEFQKVRVEGEIKALHPTVVGAKVVPGVELFGYGAKMPKAPDGYVIVESDYTCGSQVLWANADKQRALVHAIIGVNHEAQLVLYERAFFVPKEMAAKVKPPRPSNAYVPETEEARAARVRAEAITQRAERIAVPGIVPAEEGESFAGTPIEGRVFWPKWGRSDDFTHAELGEGVLVPILVFVSKDEVEAKRERAAQLVDADAVRVAAEKAAKEQERAEAKAAKEARVEALIANPPSIIYDVAEDMAFYRWENGSYMDVAEGSPEAQAGEGEVGYDDLGDLLDTIDVDEVQTAANAYELLALVAKAHEERDEGADEDEQEVELEDAA